MARTRWAPKKSTGGLGPQQGTMAKPKANSLSGICARRNAARQAERAATNVLVSASWRLIRVQKELAEAREAVDAAQAALDKAKADHEAARKPWAAVKETLRAANIDGLELSNSEAESHSDSDTSSEDE